MKYLQNTPAHEPPMQGIDNQHRYFLVVQGHPARKSSGSSHLDPLPSSDEGRGNPIVPVRRTSAWVTERSDLSSPLQKGRDQGENSPIQIAQCAPEPGKSADVDYQWLANTVHGQGCWSFSWRNSMEVGTGSGRALFLIVWLRPRFA